MKDGFYIGIVSSLLWETIKRDLFAKEVRLPDILSGSRQETENECREQEK